MSGLAGRRNRCGRDSSAQPAPRIMRCQLTGFEWVANRSFRPNKLARHRSDAKSALLTPQQMSSACQERPANLVLCQPREALSLRAGKGTSLLATFASARACGCGRWKILFATLDGCRTCRPTTSAAVRHSGDAPSIGWILARHRAFDRVAVKWSGGNKQGSQKHESCDGCNAFHPTLPKVTVPIGRLKR